MLVVELLKKKNSRLADDWLTGIGERKRKYGRIEPLPVQLPEWAREESAEYGTEHQVEYDRSKRCYRPQDSQNES